MAEEKKQIEVLQELQLKKKWYKIQTIKILVAYKKTWLIVKEYAGGKSERKVCKKKTTLQVSG